MNKPIEVRFLTKTIDQELSPVDIFSSLTDGGAKTDTLLLESGEPGACACDKSILITQSALKVTAFGVKLIIEALTPNGESILRNFSCHSANEINRTSTTIELNCSGPSTKIEQQQRLLDDNIFSPIRELMNSFVANDENSATSTMLCGAFGYELIDAFETITPFDSNTLDKPDLYLLLPETKITFNHLFQNQKLEQLVVNETENESRYHHATQKLADLDKSVQTAMRLEELENYSTNLDQSKVVLSINDEDFKRIVIDCQGFIKEGDVFQIVPSRSFSIPCTSPLTSYRFLAKNNPSPYQFYLSAERFQLFGASPESAVKYSQKTNMVDLYPIAGTVKRGKYKNGEINQDEDNRLECALRLDAKELAEHMMLVDLARNDIARLSQTATRRVSELLKVDRYSHVMHLVSKVEGQLKNELDGLHAYQGCLNMGTLTGAPKIRASELIREIEQTPRGFYGGAMGYIDAKGNLDTAIIIRSAIVEDGVAKISAGAGIVADSDPQSEVNETRQKAMAVIQSVLESSVFLRNQGAKNAD